MTEARPASLGKRLRQERELRHWTQEQLAERIGRSVPSINRWEHDRAEPQADALQELIALFGKPPERWGISRWNVPFLRNPYFTGREPLLSSLHRALGADNTTASSQTRALSGLGGIGKTQTAIEYAYRYAREYEAVLWVQADSPDMLVSEFTRLAQTLDLPVREEQEQWRIVNAVKRWLADHGGWLLILDNADDLASIADFLPRGVSGATLVTTRSQPTGKIARSIAVDKMAMAEGIRFLLRRTSLLSEDEPLETVSAATRTAAQQLVEELDGLPLALEQAGAYIDESGCGLSDYLALYRQHRLALLKRESSPGSEYPYTVASTWTLSFSNVEQANPAAADLLRLCAFLHPDAIPEEILAKGAAFLGPSLQAVATDALRLNEAIQLVRRYSLVKRDPEARLLNLHRLVQLVLRESLDAAMQRQWAERVVLAVNAAFPSAEYKTSPQCERLLSQALTAAQLIEQYQIARQEAARLLHETADYLSHFARYREAEPLYRQALRIREQQWGPEHPEVAGSLNNLADLFFRQGKYAETEPLCLRALHIFEQQFGPEDLDVSFPLHSLADLYREQGRYAEAEPLYRRVLAIREPHGSNHPGMAYPLSNLADLYREQGRYAEAEPLYRRALRIKEQQLGQEHPEMASTLNGLAELFYVQGKYEQAEQLYYQALHIHEQQIGPEHPDMAQPLNSLANLYLEQGRYAEAEPLYQRALSIREQQLALKHPDTAKTMHDFALFREAQGNREAAESLYARALAIREQALGAQHLKTIETRARLIALLHAMGRHEDAASLDVAHRE